MLTGNSYRKGIEMSAKVHNVAKFEELTREKSAKLNDTQDDDAAPVGSSNSIRQMSLEGSLRSGCSNPSADDEPTDEGIYLGAKHYMPASELVESIPLAPDITMFCQKCQRYINISDLKQHGSYHEALRIFQYKDLEQPANLWALTGRRKTMIKEMFKKLDSCEESPDPAWLRKLDDAFEIIRAELECNARRVFGVNSPRVRGISVKCESMTCIKAIGSCYAFNERWKNVMDEEKTCENCFGGDPTKCFLGIYSGYNGPNAARMSARELHKVLQSEIEKFDRCFHPETWQTSAIGQDFSQAQRTQDVLDSNVPHSIHSSLYSVAQKVNSEDFKTTSDEATHMKTSAQEGGTNLPCRKYKNNITYARKISDAFVTAHRSVDEMLFSGKGETSKVRWSGCSTLTCLIQSHENNSVKEEFPEEDRGAVEEKKGDQGAPKGGQGAPKGEKCSLRENLDTSPHHQLESQQKPSCQRKHLATIHLANAGDVRAVLVRRNKPTCLTAIHTPANTKEHQRVTKLGGTVSHSHKDFRLNGVIATTRGLGNHGDQLLKKCVTNRPFTASIPVDEFCQLLILASNGVWQVLSDEEASDLLLEMLPCHIIQPPSVLSITVGDLLRGGTKKNWDSVTNDFEEDNLTSFCSPKFRPSSSSKDPGKRATMHYLDKDLEYLSERDSVTGSHAFVKRNNTSDKMSTTCKGCVNENSDKCSSQNNTQDSFSHVLEDFAENSSNIFSSLKKLETHVDNADMDPQTVLSESSIQMEEMIAVEDEALHLSRLMAERLVQAALMAGTKNNVTVIVVLFSEPINRDPNKRPYYTLRPVL